MLCVGDTCKKVRKLHNKGFHRQHNSSEIHNKIWRNSFTPTTEISSDDSGLLYNGKSNLRKGRNKNKETV
jgi:hypothetical protein